MLIIVNKLKYEHYETLQSRRNSGDTKSDKNDSVSLYQSQKNQSI